MKKIIGIIAAVAMAASVFAADVKATVKLNGTLLGVDKDGNASALSIKNDATASYKAGFGLSASDDNAGASFNMWYDENTDVVKSGNWQIWLKPIDMLKIVVGDQGYNLHQESITWTKSQSGSNGGQGYGFVLTPTDGVEVTAALLPGWKNLWYNDGVISNTYLKVKFSNFSAMVRTSTNADKKFDNWTFGVGYDTNLSGVNFWANVLVDIMKSHNIANSWEPEDIKNVYNKDGEVTLGVEKIRLETFFEGSADSFSWKLWAPVNIYPNPYADLAYYAKGSVDTRIQWDKKSKDEQSKAPAEANPIKHRKFADFLPIAYAQLNVGAITPSIQLSFDDVIGGIIDDDTKFGVEVTLKIAGSVGMCGWDISVTKKLNEDMDSSISIPVNFTVNF